MSTVAVRSRQLPAARTRWPRAFIVGAAISGLATLLAVIGPWVAPYSPTRATTAVLLPPSARHWLGTDSSGMDVFSRVIAAPRTDLTIALAATALAVVIGTAVGALAGYHRAWWSEFVMRISDLLQSFPVFILAMLAVIVTGHSVTSLIYVLAIVNAPIYVRLVRAEILSLRERAYVEAAVAFGERGWTVIYRHLVPNAYGPLLANASITVGWTMLLTAGLSFIGAGVRLPTPEWGAMIAVGAPDVATGQWWPSVFPGLALSATVFGFALLGDSLARLTDPAYKT